MATQRKTSRRPPALRRTGRLFVEILEPRRVLDAALAEAIDDTFVARQNALPALLDVLENDLFDEQYEGDRQITSVSYGSQGGSVEIAADLSTVLYSPPADFAGLETFLYVVDFEYVAEVRVTVEAPLVSDEFEIPPDGQVHALDVLKNDPFWNDYDGPRRITSVSVSSAGGTVTIDSDGQAILYTPPDAVFSRDDFIYIVDAIYPARVTISIPPTLESDRFEMVMNSQATLPVLENDPFWPGYPGERRATHVSESALGATIEISSDGAALVYTPPAQVWGWDSFHYVVDSQYEAFVNVVVHRPVRDDWFQIDQDSTQHDLDVLPNDTFVDLSGTTRDVVERVTSVSEPQSGGTASVAPDGRSILYSPPAGFLGSDTFTYLADGLHEARVTIQVTLPVRDDHYFDGVYQDTPNARLDVLANDFLGNGYTGPRLITSVGPAENGGTATLAPDNRSLLYTPPPGYVGQDRFTYTVDGHLEAHVTLAVRALAQNDHYHFCADPAGIPFVLDVLANDYFQRGYAGPGVITALSSPSEGGSVELIAGGQVLFTPSSAEWNSFEYTVDDQYTTTAWVSLTGHLAGDSFVVDQNSPAAALDVLANDFMFDLRYTCKSRDYQGPRRVTSVTPSEQGGSVEVSADGTSVVYTPPADFHGSDRFHYIVDGLMQASVNVEVIRRVRDDLFRVPEGAATRALNVLVNDLFGADYQGPQQITAVSATQAGGTVSVGSDRRSIDYTPPAGFSGTDLFVYAVDGALKAEVRIVVGEDGDEQVSRFETLGNFQQFLIDDALQRYEYLFGESAYVGCPTCVEFDDVIETSAGPGQDRSHSETNVQVEGVDEGDIVEFDADYIYVLTAGELVIADAWPAEELHVASRMEIEGTPIAEFLLDDRLTVISQSGGRLPEPWLDVAFGPPQPTAPPTTIVTVLDVSDRTAPAVVQASSIEGWFVEARGVGDYVYVLVRNDNAVAPPPLWIPDENNFAVPGDPVSPDDPPLLPAAPPSGRYETREEYLQRITANPGELVDHALPNYSGYGSDGQLARSGLVTDAEEILQPIVAGATNLITIVSLHVTADDPGLSSTSSVYGSGASSVYASLENFYVFDHDYQTEDGAMTRIVKFNWNADLGEVDFAATTAVPGSILNQFSADERAGDLRIATTVGNQGSGNWSGRTENLLFVLREDQGIFETIGSLQNLALGETIRSIRYQGERAFVTTFRTVDPLFVIDLSDPADPRTLGHLTLPGFSSYIHLLDGTHLLTVGQNTSGVVGGPTQVSLFEVSDLSRPRLIDQHTFARFSSSEAEVDHHAFGYFAEHGLLAIPMRQGYFERVDSDGDGYRETSRWVERHHLAVFSIDSALTEPSSTGVDLWSEIEHDGLVRRSGYIDDVLYSIAVDTLKAVRLDEPQTIVGEVTLTAPVEPPLEPVIPGEDASAGDGAVDGTRFPAALVEGPPAAAVRHAQSHLAALLGIEPGAALLVALDRTAASPVEEIRIVLRAGDRHYLYLSRGSALLIDNAFAFDGTAAHSTIWHAVPSPTPPLRGDMDADGDTDYDDILPFVLGISRPLGYERLWGVSPAWHGDLDGDNDFDFDDIDELATLLGGRGEPTQHEGHSGEGL